MLRCCGPLNPIENMSGTSFLSDERRGPLRGPYP